MTCEPSAPVLTLDLGGTKTRAALVHGAGGHGEEMAPRLEGVAEVPTPARDGAEAILGTALELAEQVRGAAAVRAVGLSSAGVIDSVRGTVTHATDSLTRWAGTDLRTPLAARLGVPVSVLNDVHAHGLGEARYGTGRGRASLLLVAVGTGIGGAHAVDGRILSGAHGAAGHIGHLPVSEAAGVPCPCGRSGHLEGLASGPGILRLAHRLGADPSLRDGRSLAAQAAAEDGPARAAYHLAGRATGRAVGALANVLDPEVVAVTGGVAEVGALWHGAVAEGLALEAMDVVVSVPVLPASAGSHAALLGAAARALDELPSSPPLR